MLLLPPDDKMQFETEPFVLKVGTGGEIQLQSLHSIPSLLCRGQVGSTHGTALGIIIILRFFHEPDLMFGALWYLNKARTLLGLSHREQRT